MKGLIITTLVITLSTLAFSLIVNMQQQKDIRALKESVMTMAYKQFLLKTAIKNMKGLTK